MKIDLRPKIINPVFVILMRSDMASMNPGKACAQASHAANHMVKVLSSESDAYWKEALAMWQESTKQGFGTCIVRHGFQYDIEDFLKHMPGSFLKGQVVDPTYPLPDGNFTHYISIPTCAWAFGEETELYEVRSRFALMP